MSKRSHRLAVLARLRQQQELRALERLAQSTLRVTQAQQALEQVEGDLARLRDGASTRMRQSVLSGGQLSLLRHDVEHAARAQAAQAQAVAARIRERGEVLQAFGAARALRKGMDELVARARRDDRAAAAKAEQRLQDEGAALTLGRREVA